MLPKDPTKVEEYKKRISETLKRKHENGEIDVKKQQEKRVATLKKSYAEGKIVNGMTGKKPWNFGLTKETDKRIEKGSNKLKETLATEESKQRKSESRKELCKDPQFIKKLSDSLLGHEVSLETRKKQSDKAKGRIPSEESRNKNSIAHTGKIVSQETRDRMGRWQKDKPKSEEQRNKISNTLIEGYASGRIKVVYHPIFKDTKPELAVKKILDDNNIEFKSQWFINTVDGIRFYDFYLPKYNFIIEVDGTFWHGKGLEDNELKYDMLKKARESDKIKNQLAKDKGFRLFRVWEDELYKLENLIKKDFQI